jgi:cytochrome c6
MISRNMLLITLLLVVSLILSACARNENEPAPGPEPELVPTQVVEEPPPTPTDPPPTPEVEQPTPTPEPEVDDIPETGEGLLAAGAEIYIDACAGCHQNDGSGVQGIYPPLNNNPFVAANDPTGVTAVIITGRGGMPTFHDILDANEIAAVTSFIRSGWNNDAAPVSVEEVNQIWQQTGMPQEDEEEDD